jgi:hypothetical protein
MFVSFSTAAVGFGLLIGTAILGKDKVLERWCLHQLERGGDEEKFRAAEKLGELGSVQAISFLFKGMKDDLRKCFEGERSEVNINGAGYSLGIRGKRFQASLVKMGRPAVPMLISSLTNDDLTGLLLAYETLEKMDRELWSHLSPFPDWRPKF